MRICVYAASSGKVDPAYLDAAHELGRTLARAGCTTVYGGGGQGLMGALADGAIAEGGEVIGIIPKFMVDLATLTGAPRARSGIAGKMLRCVAVLFIVCLAATWVPLAHAYIPATPTNQTKVAQAAGLNFSDVSTLDMQWFPMGSYKENVSYQLVGAYSNGINKVCYYYSIT